MQTNSMDGIVEQAKTFVIIRHGEQVRKYTGEPYWYHLRNVAELVSRVGGTDAMVAAAWLHDVVEDTPTTIEEIETRFGALIAEMVLALTNCDASAGNRRVRKILDTLRLADAIAPVHTIKLADLIDNTESIVERDPGFAKVYLSEKADLLDVLDRGDERLMFLARYLLFRGFERIHGTNTPKRNNDY